MSNGELERGVQAFRNTIEKLVKDKAPLLTTLKGDLFFDIGGDPFTLDTKNGAIVAGAKTSTVAFELVADADVFLSLIDARIHCDLDKAEDEGRFRMDGDFSVFERLLRLITNEGAPAWRAGMIGNDDTI